jgi:predicted acetyltransferase
MAEMLRFNPELVTPVVAEDIPAWTRSMVTTFLGDPGGAQTARRINLLTRCWEPSRAWGVRDQGRWVATLRTGERTLAVPGAGDTTKDLRVDAVTNVTVAATHRRRGLMSRMLDGSLRAARERGDGVSILIAAEWPIYGRFGYAPAILSADYRLRCSRPGATCPGEPARVRQVTRDEFGEVAPAVYAESRRCRAGQIDRDARWWNQLLGRDGYAASDQLPHNWFVHEGDDGPDGLLSWTATGDFNLVPPLGTVEVGDLVSANDIAYRDLWAYLSGIDGIEQVSLSNRPVDEPVRWLLGDGRALVLSQQVDLVWLRLLDVPAALAARRYAIPEDIVIEVIDEDAGRFASGRYRLRADGDDVECARTNDDVDVEITQRTLASIYLGAFRLRELMLADVARERTPGAIARLDLMFSTPLSPWNATWF